MWCLSYGDHFCGQMENYCNEIGKGFFFLTRQRLLGNWLFEKKIKKSIGGVVYIDLHNPESAVK